MPANIYFLYIFFKSAIFNWSTEMFFSVASNCDVLNFVSKHEHVCFFVIVKPV